MTTQITPAHGKLEVFVGEWQLRGEQHAGFFGPAPTKVDGKETFEWLRGGRYLIHRLDGTLGDDEMACVEIWEVGDDGGYTLHTFYNDGTRHVWQAREEGGVWTIRADRDVAGTPWKIRCRMELIDGGARRTGEWERSLDGGRSWDRFWTVEAARR